MTLDGPPRIKVANRNTQKYRCKYSHIKNISSVLPPNSMRWPPTSSDSASVWSCGARLLSIKQKAIKIKASGVKATNKLGERLDVGLVNE